MFSNATSFNQDISNWNISRDSKTNGMFSNATTIIQSINFIPTAVRQRVELDNRRVTERQNRIREVREREIREQERIEQEIRDRANRENRENIQRQRNPGIAFNVHNIFKNINIDELIKLINNGNLDIYESTTSDFKQYVLNELQNMLNNYSRDNKSELQEKFNNISNKIMSINYKNNNIKNLYYTVLNFIKNQDGWLIANTHFI